MRHALIFVGCFVSVAGIVRADDKSDCANAYSTAQDLRAANKLKAAKEQLMTCARPTCPTVVTEECAKWLVEVNGSTPTVVFAAKDGQGSDLVDARLFIDGTLATDKLDGTAIALDPGLHSIRLERDGEQPVEKSLVARVGEQNRAFEISFEAHVQPPPVAPVVVTTPKPDVPAPQPRSAPVGAYIALGVGGAGLVLTTVFGVLALNDKSSLDSACGVTKNGCPSSSQNDIDALHLNSLVSDVSLAVGLVGVVVGSVMLVLHATSSVKPAIAVRGSALVGTF